MLLLLTFLLLVGWLFWRSRPSASPTSPVASTAAPPPEAAPAPPAPMTMVAQVALEPEPAAAPATLVVAESFATSDAPAVVMFAPEVPPTAEGLAEEPAVTEPEPPVEDPVSLSTTLPTADALFDDFTLIEGIRPKISKLLHQAGITTFGQLSTTSPEQLRAILDAARIRIAAPTTWPEQAALAAAQQWDELKALQSTLKGGKRVG